MGVATGAVLSESCGRFVAIHFPYRNIQPQLYRPRRLQESALFDEGYAVLCEKRVEIAVAQEFQVVLHME
jgi:hypothetical protein